MPDRHRGCGVSGIANVLLAVFDGDQGAFFFVVLITLLIAGTILLIVNLGQRNRPAPAPAWQPVADEEPATVSATDNATEPAQPTPARRTAPRRKA